MDGYASIEFDDLVFEEYPYDMRAIVYRDAQRIVVQDYTKVNGNYRWNDTVTVYYAADPPTSGVKPDTVRLPDIPDAFEPVEGVRQWPKGEELLALVKSELGDRGLVGVYCGTTLLVHSESQIYDFYDNPDKYVDRRDRLLEYYEKRFKRLMSLSCKPDFIATGGSGTFIHQTPETFRLLGLPIVKRMTALAKEYGLPSHIHSCGPEKGLVKICAEETDLTIIDPLEIPPMGDCDLRELKRLYGGRMVLKGNRHTTSVMLHGSVRDVVDASKRAIDDAAEGGRFILSTGDQCGRDTPHENIFAMIETARTYGKY
jgi:uroporphyrinogen decarboxylase